MPLAAGADLRGLHHRAASGPAVWARSTWPSIHVCPAATRSRCCPSTCAPTASTAQRFDREADIAATLWHPHIVGVHDRGDVDGQIWISMDYVAGPTRSRLLRERCRACPERKSRDRQRRRRCSRLCTSARGPADRLLLPMKLAVVAARSPRVPPQSRFHRPHSLSTFERMRLRVARGGRATPWRTSQYASVYPYRPIGPGGSARRPAACRISLDLPAFLAW